MAPDAARGQGGRPLNRRRFLFAITLVGLSAMATFVGGRLTYRSRVALPTASNGDLLDEALLALCRLCGRRSTIGERYLAVHAPASDRHLVLAELRSRLPELGERRRNASDLLGALRRRIRDDFAVGEIVMLDGWLLARTEVQLCALSVLVNP
jgi:hypothetical protein